MQNEVVESSRVETYRGSPIYAKVTLRADGGGFVSFWQTSRGRPWVRVGTQNLKVNAMIFDNLAAARDAAVDAARSEIDAGIAAKLARKTVTDPKDASKLAHKTSSDGE